MDEAAMDRAAQPTRADQYRIAQRLKAGLLGDLETRHPAGACLHPLLSVLGWRGEKRHVLEAMPHFDDVETLDDLRAVMARLNFEVAASARSAPGLGEQHLPCLIEAPDGRVSVILERDGDAFLVFDGVERDFVYRAATELAGRLYVIRAVDEEAAERDVHKHGWIGVLLRRFRILFVQLLGITFLSNLFALAVPIYVMNVYDKVIGTKSGETLAYFFAGIVIVLAADLALRTIRGRALAYLGARLDTILGATAFQQLLHLPINMIERAPMGAQITRLKQFEGVREVFTGAMASAFLDLPFVLVFIAAIIVIGGMVALVPIALIVAFAIMAACTIPLSRLHVAATGEARAKMQNFLIELATHHRAIKEAGVEAVWNERYGVLSGEAARRHLHSEQLNYTVQTLAQTFVTIAGVATLGIGTLLVMRGELSLGALIAVMAFVWRVLAPIQSIFLSLNRIGRVSESFKQINQLMRIKLERQPGHVPSFYRNFEGSVLVARVGFRYSARSEPALMGATLDIPPGQVVALSGPSGAGKSTLLKVIAGLYAPQAGAVQVDGLDIRQLDSGELRHAIAFVPQKQTFFYGTVAQNLRLGHPTATDEEIARAAHAAALDDYADHLPDGYETRLAIERRSGVTDGLLQRLMLARAYVKDAPIYLLDEPAQNLDRSGDEALMAKLESLKGKATVIMVTHRPSHMRLADRLVYMEQGQIVHDGKPEQVLPLIYK